MLSFKQRLLGRGFDGGPTFLWIGGQKSSLEELVEIVNHADTITGSNGSRLLVRVGCEYYVAGDETDDDEEFDLSSDTDWSWDERSFSDLSSVTTSPTRSPRVSMYAML